MNALQHTQKEIVMKSYLTRHPIVAYFALAFAGTWLFLAPIVFSQNGLGLFTFTVPFGIFALLFILATFAGPTLAAFVVTGVLEGKAGVKAFLRRYIQWRVGLHWYLIALFGYLLVSIVAMTFILGAEPWLYLASNGSKLFTAFLPAVLIFPALITWGEEPGWRGFALTRMQPLYGPIKSSLMLGFLHSLWHLPIFFIVTGPVAFGPFNLMAFVQNTISIMLITIVWTWIFNNAKGSILIAVLMHAAFNATGGLLPAIPETALQTASIVGLVVNLLLAALVIVFTKGRLGYRKVLDLSPTQLQLKTTPSRA
jgi:membrane protease YdiL (CAAX protease family)